MIEHIIVTRFSMKWPEPKLCEYHKNQRWLENRALLYLKYCYPPILETRARVYLLASDESIEWVRKRFRDKPGITVLTPDDYLHRTFDPSNRDKVWYTRLDSDDVIEPTWFDEVDRNADLPVTVFGSLVTKSEKANGEVIVHHRPHPIALQTWKYSLNPYQIEHRAASRIMGQWIHIFPGCFLTRRLHSENVSQIRRRLGSSQEAWSNVEGFDRYLNEHERERGPQK